jgi:hypothetical protein
VHLYINVSIEIVSLIAGFFLILIDLLISREKMQEIMINMGCEKRKKKKRKLNLLTSSE